MASSVVCLPPLSSAATWTCCSQPLLLPLPAHKRCAVRSPVSASSAELEASASTSPSSSLSSRSLKYKGASKNRQVMLRFVWMEKNIGIALDQVVPGHGTVPLSSYYFWPRKDAWEEIKTKLESKKWISRKQTILLLNQATDVINLWQQNATG